MQCQIIFEGLINHSYQLELKQYQNLILKQINPIMLLKHISKNWYHIRKPRQVTQNVLSLRQYRRDLTAARRQVHIQAAEYQNAIEDQYLQKHAQNMKQRHFNNQCDFRKRIAQEGFRLQQNIETWKKQDQKTIQKFNNYLHKQDLKRINRQRIKKIMTFESQNYWYNSDNVEQRLTDEVIFPQYIASTEYYHRLHTEALVYENYDFHLLHRVRSNQEVIKEKNRQLIPIFNQIKLKIKEYKTDKQKEISYLHQIALDKINILNIDQDQKSKLIAEEKSQYEKKIAQYKDRLVDPVKRQNLMRQKLRILLSILSSWKEYTNILGMTSGQMMKQIEESKRESNISSIRENVMSDIKSVKNTTFVDAIEQDTEDVEITLEDYISKLKAYEIQDDSVLDQKQSAQVIELDGLLKQAEQQLKASKSNISKSSSQQKVNINLGSLIEGLQSSTTEMEMREIPMSYLNVNETTSSVEIMKEMYKDDGEMLMLLNQIGEVGVEYPKLFKQIWDSTHTVA